MSIHSYFGRFRRRAKPAAKARTARPRLGLEALEDRFVPSTLGLDSASGLVTYQAASGEANRLEISLQTTSSGTFYHFEETKGVGITMGATTNSYFDIGVSLVKNIQVNFNDPLSPDNMNDTLKVISSDVKVNVAGGNGSDTVTVGGGGRGAEDVTAPVVFDGGSQKANGQDVLVLADRNAPAVSTPTTTTLDYFFQGGAVTRERVDSSGKSLGFVRYSSTNVEELDVNGSKQSDTYEVGSTLAGTQVVISAGDGDDSVSTLFNLDNLAGGLTVEGDGGTDTLTINDGSAPVSRNYVITTGTVSEGSAVVTLGDTLEGGLTLDASNKGSTIDIQSANGLMPLTLNGGIGSDTVTVSDSALTTFQTYQFNAGNLERTVFVPFLPPLPTAHINYSGIDKLVVNAGSGGDTFLLTETAQPQLELNGGGGTDEINYSAFTSNVTVNLALGTANKVTKLSNVENVVGGAGNDIIVGDAKNNVLQGNAGRDVIIGGEGADTLQGGADDDILIGGTTAYDTNEASLKTIRSTWAGAGSTKDRVNTLKQGVSGVKLDSTTVFDDGVSDVVAGDDPTSPTPDWFWVNSAQDTLTDFTSSSDFLN